MTFSIRKTLEKTWRETLLFLPILIIYKGMYSNDDIP